MTGSLAVFGFLFAAKRGANKMASCSNTLFAAYFALSFEKKGDGSMKIDLSSRNDQYGKEVREEAMRRCPGITVDNFKIAVDFERVCDDQRFTEIQKLNLLGCTSIIPAQPTSVSSVMERSVSMHEKVIEPCPESCKKFLAYVAKADIFWFLRKYKPSEEIS